MDEGVCWAMNSATKPGHYVMERRGKGRIDATVIRDAGEQSRQATPAPAGDAGF